MILPGIDRAKTALLVALLAALSGAGMWIWALQNKAAVLTAQLEACGAINRSHAAAAATYSAETERLHEAAQLARKKGQQALQKAREAAAKARPAEDALSALASAGGPPGATCTAAVADIRGALQ